MSSALSRGSDRPSDRHSDRAASDRAHSERAHSDRASSVDAFGSELLPLSPLGAQRSPSPFATRDTVVDAFGTQLSPSPLGTRAAVRSSALNADGSDRSPSPFGTKLSPSPFTNRAGSRWGVSLGRLRLGVSVCFRHIHADASPPRPRDRIRHGQCDAGSVFVCLSVCTRVCAGVSVILLLCLVLSRCHGSLSRL